MGQNQLPVIIAAGPDKILHDLDQNPAGIELQVLIGAANHLVAKGTESGKPMRYLAAFQRLEKMNHGISNAQSLGFSHLLDAARMKLVKKPSLGLKLGCVRGKHIIDYLDQVMIPAIKKNNRFSRR